MQAGQTLPKLIEDILEMEEERANDIKDLSAGMPWQSAAGAGAISFWFCPRCAGRIDPLHLGIELASELSLLRERLADGIEDIDEVARAADLAHQRDPL